MRRPSLRRTPILNRTEIARVLEESGGWIDVEDILKALDLDPQNRDYNDFAQWILQVCIRAGLAEGMQVLPGYVCYRMAQPEPPSSDLFLRRIRNMTGTSQSELSQIVNKCPTAISSFERHPIIRHRLPSVQSYLQALGCRVTLLTQDGSEVNSTLVRTLRRSMDITQPMIALALGYKYWSFSLAERSILELQLKRILQILYEVLETRVVLRVDFINGSCPSVELALPLVV